MKLFQKNPTHNANLSYAGFDMSFNCKFTSSVGQLIPVLYDFLLTGDKVKISEEMFTRTQPLSTAAFIDLKEHIEYFFVPINQLFSLWSSFRYSVGQPLSSVFDPSKTQQNMPGMDFSNLMIQLLDVFRDTLPDEDPTAHNLTYPYNVSFLGSYQNTFEKSNYMGHRRIAHMLGYGYDGTDHDNLWQGETPTGLKYNPLVACAYQKVFFDHYNIDQRQEKQRVCYNLDCWYSDNADQTTNPTAHYLDYKKANYYWFMPRYVPWKKDYFTGMYVSPLESPSSKNTSFFGANLNQITDYINSLTPLPSTPDGSAALSSDSAASIGLDTRSTSNINFNGLNNRLNTQFIRKMFALEKFLSITRRSKDDYRSLTLAHFGTDMSPIYSDLSLQLGSTHQTIVVNDVAATVNNENTSLGELSGKAAAFKSANGDTVQFTAPCEGILLGIYYARPEIDYKQRGLDRLHTCMKPSDFYTPEYANLGLQPVFAHELDMSSSDWQAVESNINRVIGWQYRYSQFKSKINKVFTGFTEPSLSDWTISSNFDFSSFGGNTSDYYVNPSALDSIMIEKYKGGDIGVTDWNFSFDPLLHWFHFNYFKVSVMDAYGLPQL